MGLRISLSLFVLGLLCESWYNIKVVVTILVTMLVTLFLRFGRNYSETYSSAHNARSTVIYNSSPLFLLPASMWLSCPCVIPAALASLYRVSPLASLSSLIRMPMLERLFIRVGVMLYQCWLTFPCLAAYRPLYGQYPTRGCGDS